MKQYVTRAYAELCAILIFLILIVGAVSGADENTDILRYKKQIDSLQTHRDRLTVSIDSKIDSLKKLCIDIELSIIGDEGLIVKTKRAGNMRMKPMMTSTVIRHIPKKAEVLIIDVAVDEYLVIYQGSKGYIGNHLLALSDSEKALAVALHNKRVEKEEEALRRRNAEHKLAQENKQIEANALKVRLREIKDAYEMYPAWIIVNKANIRVFPDTSAKIIMKMDFGSKVYFQKEEGRWAQVMIRSGAGSIYGHGDENSFKSQYTTCWVYRTLITRNRELLYKNQVHIPTQAELRRKDFVDSNPRLSLVYAIAVLEGRVMIGMSKDMVIASIGFPKDQNRTVTASNVHEQWIYWNTYVYFDNDVVTAWQD